MTCCQMGISKSMALSAEMIAGLILSATCLCEESSLRIKKSASYSGGSGD